MVSRLNLASLPLINFLFVINGMRRRAHLFCEHENKAPLKDTYIRSFFSEMSEMFKAMGLGAVLSGSLALVIGSQGSSAGPLEIHALMIAGQKIYWSWPIFLGGTGVAWGLMALQR